MGMRGLTKKAALKPEQGSILIIIMSILGVAAIAGALALSNSQQNARANRSVASKVEANILFESTKQVLNNEILCTNAMKQNKVTFAPTPNGLPTPTMISSLITTGSSGDKYKIATAAMNSNDITVSSASTGSDTNPTSGPVAKLQAESTSYVDYGVQTSTDPNINGNDCLQATLTLSANTNAANTMGGNIITQDFPITLFTNGGVVEGCVGGNSANFCTTAVSATVNLSVPTADACITTSAHTATFEWTATNQNYVTINCTSPAVSSANLTTSPSTVDMAAVPAGTTETCTATAYNSALQPSAPSTPVTVNVNTTCNPPAVSITSVPTCVHVNSPYTITWTDSDTASTGVQSFTGIGIPPGPFTPPLPGNSVTPPAPTATGSLKYTISDTNLGETTSDSATVLVVSPPSFSTPLSASPKTSPPGGNITFTYATSNATAVSLTDPVSGASISEPISGPLQLTAPAAAGTHQYILTLTGASCPSDTPVTSEVDICTTGCGLQSSYCGTPPDGCGGTCIAGTDVSCSGGVATCGSANNAGVATQPSSNLCSDGSPAAVILSGSNWTWSCGTPAVPCSAPDTGSGPDVSACPVACGGTGFYCTTTAEVCNNRPYGPRPRAPYCSTTDVTSFPTDGNECACHSSNGDVCYPATGGDISCASCLPTTPAPTTPTTPTLPKCNGQGHPAYSPALGSSCDAITYGSCDPGCTAVFVSGCGHVSCE
jgi:hypothetical protein